MPALTRLHQIAAKLETAEGTDPWGGGQPAAADVISVIDPAVSDTPDFIELLTSGGSLSRGFDVVGRVQRQFTFRSQFVGNTTGATDDDKRNAAPPWEPLIKAAGFQAASLVRVTGTVTSGPFYIGERVGDSSWGGGEPTNWGVAMTDGTGHLMIADVKGTMGAAAAVYGEQSGASIATATPDPTGGRAYKPEDERLIDVDLTVAGWSGAPPTAGDVVLVKRSGEQVGAALVTVVADPIRLSVYYGTVVENDVLETAGGSTATVEAASAITIVSSPTTALYSNLSTKARKSLGARGDFQVGGDAGQVLLFSWTFRGSAPTPYDDPLITGVALTPLQGPRWIGATVHMGYDRGGGTYFNTALPIKSFSFTPAGVLNDRDDAAAATGIIGAFLASRDPQVDISVEQGSVLGFDWDTLKDNATPVRFGMHFGSAVGNILALAVPNGQVVAVTDGDANGIATHQISIKPRRIRDDGKDEVHLAKF